MTDLRYQHCAICELKLDKGVPGKPNTLDDAMRAQCTRILCGPCVREYIWPVSRAPQRSITTNGMMWSWNR